MSRLDHLSENTLVERIKYLTLQLEEIKTKQSIGGETWLQLTPQWTDSWTNLTTFQFVTGSFGKIDFNDWRNYNWYWEVIGFTDGGTAHYRLWNDTDSEAVADSEITTTITDSNNPAFLRSPILTKYDGDKVFRVQVRRQGGSGYANVVMARIIFKVEV